MHYLSSESVSDSVFPLALLYVSNWTDAVALRSKGKADSHVAVTDTNKTSDQRSYLHINIIFLVIILILKHVLFRLVQKYPSPIINCLLCCMNCCYSWGVIRKSHRIHTCSHGIKFYDYTFRMRSDAVLSFTGAVLTKTVTN